MGVIRNPEKISYMLDTKFINFREFQILGGLGMSGGAQSVGVDTYNTVPIIFFKIYAQIRDFIEKK